MVDPPPPPDVPQLNVCALVSKLRCCPPVSVQLGRLVYVAVFPAVITGVVLVDGPEE
jgi:hypothetical protein